MFDVFYDDDDDMELYEIECLREDIALDIEESRNSKNEEEIFPEEEI